jgi:hypothetical protein
MSGNDDLDSQRGVAEPRAFAFVSPPDITYDPPPELARRWAESDALTARQLGTVRLACQALLRPPGAFFLGDGPGCGKTRVLAGVAACRGEATTVWVVPNLALKRKAMLEIRLLGVETPVALLSYAQLAAYSPPEGAPFLLLLDEAHLCRHEGKAASAARRLQEQAAGVVYSTATPASEVAALGYMSRLRLWGDETSFADFDAFQRALRRWGLGAAELLALDLKRRGLYSCVRLPEAPVRDLELSPTPALERLFDACAAAWRSPPHQQQPGSFAHRLLFFQRLAPALKARLLADRWRRDLAEGFAVVAVVQGTGAAAAREEKGSSQLLRCCRAAGVVPPPGLPEDALDEVRRALVPEPTAEISGRSGAERGFLREGSLRDLAAFRRGERRALVMSAAGTLGLDLTSPLPLRVYVLELPWTPEVLAQQLGRCHRLVTAGPPPECFAVSLRTFSERRVEAALARRGSTLGALSCADARCSVLADRLPWGPRLLRWVTLEMTLRLLRQRLGGRRCAPPTQTPEGDEARLLLLLRGESRAALFEAPSAAAFFDLAAALPRACAEAWLVPPWSPAAHALYPEAVRRAARTAAGHLSLRGRLPAPLVAHVLSFALGDDWDVEATLTSLGRGLDLLDEAQPRAFLDGCVGAPWAAQARLLRCCEEHAERCRQPPTALLRADDHVLRKHDRDAYAARFALEPQRRGRVLLRVEVRSEACAAEAPLLFLHRSLGRVMSAVAASDGRHWRLQLPGHPRPTGRDHASLADLLATEGAEALPLEGLRRYRRLEERELTRRALTAQGLCRRLLLAVQDPLSEWEHSLKVVLAAEDERGRPFVGLLLRETTPVAT